MEPARTLFFGSGVFAVPILEAVGRAPELELVAVITAPPRPAGRGGAHRSTPVALRGESLAVPILAPERLREPGLLERLGALRPAVGVLADYGKMLPAALLDLPSHGILNLHPSLLPRHRGATPIPAAIAAGDEEIGVTLFRMDPGMDTGPLVACERTPLERDENAGDVEDRLALIAAGLLARSIGGYLRGDLVPWPQPATGASTTRPLAREDGRLDAARPAVELERHVRALLPWPGTFIELGQGRLAVLAAEVGEGSADDVAGTIVPDGPGIALATGRGRLRLVVVRPAGGLPMDGAAYRRGHPGVVGARSIGPR